jgi:hypothetical protein
MYLVYWEKILVVVLVVVVDYTSPCGYYYQCRENIMIGMKALERKLGYVWRRLVETLVRTVN